MDQIQSNEIYNLILDLITIPLILFVLNNKSLPRFHYFLAAISLIILSHIFTIIESFYLYDLFNILEHTTLLLSGIFMILGIIKYILKKRP